MNAVERADRLIDELRAKAANAARRCKPTMWAYYSDCADQLSTWFDLAERTDEAYLNAAIALSESAKMAAPNLQPIEAARLWAQGIYARRIAGDTSRASLTWLRERAA